MADLKMKDRVNSFYRGGNKISSIENKDLIFQALSWEKEDRPREMDEDREFREVDGYDSSGSDDVEETKIQKKDFLVRVYGVTEEGCSVSLEIEGFRPYFFLKVQ